MATERSSRAALGLLLVGLAAGSAAAQARGLDRAETLIASAEKAAAEMPPADFCLPEPFSRSLAERLKTGDGDLLPLFSSTTAGGDLLMAHVCRAVAARSPKICGELKGIPIVPTFSQMPSKSASHTFEFRCRANYSNVLMSRAALSRDPSLARLCLDNEVTHPVFRAGKASEGCRLVGEAYSSPAVCSRLAPLLDAGATGCVESARQLTGDETYCPSIPDAMNRELCLGAAAYRKARAGAPESCGDSAVCRMMASPDALACRSYDDRLRRFICPALSELERARRSALIRPLLDSAQSLLDSDGVETNRASAARLDLLAERLARLRARFPPPSERDAGPNGPRTP